MFRGYQIENKGLLSDFIIVRFRTGESMHKFNKETSLRALSLNELNHKYSEVKNEQIKQNKKY